MRSLRVYIDQRFIGTLFEGNDLWAFEYEADWAKAPDAFDLSPALPRTRLRHEDGATNRPVQWYFDNLLPEEMLRETMAKEAGIRDHMDAFALLEYLGLESAGSLTLLAPGRELPTTGELQRLTYEELSRRITALPRSTLANEAPKRMSLAGAQHKLLVVYEAGELYEPVGATASTHILKPDHPQPDVYPASVYNEYLTMRVAHSAGLVVPPVHLLYVPQPVYLIERFDRRRPPGSSPGQSQRLHIIDACQLLNKARTFKHSGASLQALRDVIDLCTDRALTRIRLFTWLVFNVLMGNDDCHLKNLSFTVTHNGFSLAPHYDLLSTGAYHTKAIADANGAWPTVPMAIELPGAKMFGQVTLASILAAANELGVPEPTARRIVSDVIKRSAAGLHTLTAEFEQSRGGVPEPARAALGTQSRVAAVIANLTFPDMSGALQR
jgi:serine/threonine-protein kinase HipA